MAILCDCSFVLTIVMRRKYLIPAAIVLVVIEAALLRANLFGHFYQPSFLPAAATYFAIGIACRLIYPVVPAAPDTQSVFRH